jgi:26S proteasome subunit RPN7
VYEAFYLITVRDITGAAALLLDCVATFTCTELCTYEQFIFYAVSHTTCIITCVACMRKRSEVAHQNI